MQALLLLSVIAAPEAPPSEPWQPLHPGVEYRVMPFVDTPSHGDGRLHVVRIDRSRARLVVRAATALDGKNRTAGEWADEFKDIAVINAGMYETDYATHTGYLRVGSHLNNRRWVKAYKSVFVIRADGTAGILDADALHQLASSHRTVVQNLRLIASPGRNVWSRTNQRWSESAIAMDREGRILFLFTRTPLSMWRFNRLLLKSSLRIRRAHHVEGGPEASLSVRSKNINFDFSGSYETGFNTNDDNKEQWVLPNVIAVHPLSEPTK